MSQNLLPKNYAVGYLELVSKQLTLRLEIHGKIAFVKDLTAPL